MNTRTPLRISAMLTLAILFTAFAGHGYAQTTSSTPAPTPAPACASGIGYNYFAEQGVGYGSGGSITTGFGVRIGCSNAFSVTNIDSTIGQPLSAYSTLRTGIEYVVATRGLWNLAAFAAVGATTSGSVSFNGGGGVGFDLGSWLTKGKYSVLMDAQLRIAGVPGAAANVVEKSATVAFRKTF